MKCTWEGCDSENAEDIISNDGEVWCRLCRKHEKELVKSYTDKSLLSSWIKAQGGAEKAAGRMDGKMHASFEKLCKVFEKVVEGK
jgi:hypothetical protein